MQLRFPLAALALVLSVATHAPAQEVEPGVRLHSAISVVEHPVSGEPTVTAMHATGIASNTHTGSNMARGLVLSGQKNTIEVPGLHANLILTTNNPVFYVHLDSEAPSDQRPLFTLVRLKPAQETRILLNFTANSFGGGRKRHVDEVEVTKTDVDGSFLKLTPTEPLPPGEYGIVMLPKDTTMFTDRVYDFSIAAK